MPAKKTTRTAAATPRSATPRAARPAAPGKPRAKRAASAAPAATSEAAVDTAAGRAPEAAPTAAASRRPVTREDIQVRAYFLALENAGKGGSLDYWLAAERELLQGARE